MKRIGTSTVAVICGLSVIGAMCAPAMAQTEKPQDFYKGKIINYVMGDSPGAGGDVVARALSPYLAKLTGATIVIKNMSGGGGLEGPNYVWNAKPDGLTIGGLDFASVINNDLNDEPGVKFEVDKFGFLGSIGVEGTVFFVGAKSTIKSLEDLKSKKGLKFAATTPGGNRAITLMITAYCLDLDARVVTGYKGGAEADLSVQQLETDASGTVTGSFLRNEKGGLIRGIFAIDTRRVAGVSHIPALTELVKLPKEKMDLLESSLALRPSKATFITPGVPKDRLTFLQEAYWQALKQEGFRKDITKLLGYSDIVFLSGEEALTTAKTAKANKKPWQERLRFLFEKYRAGL